MCQPLKAKKKNLLFSPCARVGLRARMENYLLTSDSYLLLSWTCEIPLFSPLKLWCLWYVICFMMRPFSCTLVWSVRAHTLVIHYRRMPHLRPQRRLEALIFLKSREVKTTMFLALILKICMQQNHMYSTKATWLPSFARAL